MSAFQKRLQLRLFIGAVVVLAAAPISFGFVIWRNLNTTGQLFADDTRGALIVPPTVFAILGLLMLYAWRRWRKKHP